MLKIEKRDFLKFFVISKINIIILKKFTIFNMIFDNVGGVDHFGNGLQ